MHAATVMGVLVNCRRVRGAVWAAGGASALLPTLATASPQALRGECSCPLTLQSCVPDSCCSPGKLQPMSGLGRLTLAFVYVAKGRSCPKLVQGYCTY